MSSCPRNCPNPLPLATGISEEPLFPTVEEVTPFFEKARAWKLPVNIEVEVLKKEYPTAKKALGHLEDCIKRFRPLGFHADLFSFDEPFYNAKHVMSLGYRLRSRTMSYMR